MSHFSYGKSNVWEGSSLQAWLRTRLSELKQKCSQVQEVATAESSRAEGATVPATVADLATILQQKTSAMSNRLRLRAASKLLQLLHAAPRSN